jgi:hypothetical protein
VPNTPGLPAALDTCHNVPEPEIWRFTKSERVTSRTGGSLNEAHRCRLVPRAHQQVAPDLPILFMYYRRDGQGYPTQTALTMG